MSGISDVSYTVKSGTRTAFRAVVAAIKRLTPAQKLVADATDYKIKWGPEDAQMQKIASYSRSHSDCRDMFVVIWDNLGDTADKHWRLIYKTLLVIEHLLYQGSDEAVEIIQNNIHRIRTLNTYTYRDRNGNDQGVNVRKRSQIVADLATDDTLPEQRKKHMANLSRFNGISSGSTGGHGYYSSTSRRDQSMVDDTSRASGSRGGSSGSFPEDDGFGFSPASQPPVPESQSGPSGFAPPPRESAPQGWQTDNGFGAPAPQAVPPPAADPWGVAASPAPTTTSSANMGWGVQQQQPAAAPVAQAQTSFFQSPPAPAPAPQPQIQQSAPLIDLFGSPSQPTPQPISPAQPNVWGTTTTSAAPASAPAPLIDPLGNFGSPAPAASSPYGTSSTVPSSAQPSSGYGSGPVPLSRSRAPASPLDTLINF